MVTPVQRWRLFIITWHEGRQVFMILSSVVYLKPGHESRLVNNWLDTKFCLFTATDCIKCFIQNKISQVHVYKSCSLQPHPPICRSRQVLSFFLSIPLHCLQRWLLGIFLDLGHLEQERRRMSFSIQHWNLMYKICKFCKECSHQSVCINWTELSTRGTILL